MNPDNNTRKDAYQNEYREPLVTLTSKRDQIKQLQFIDLIILVETHDVFVVAIEENPTIVSDRVLRFQLYFHVRKGARRIRRGLQSRTLIYAFLRQAKFPFCKTFFMLAGQTFSEHRDEDVFRSVAFVPYLQGLSAWDAEVGGGVLMVADGMVPSSLMAHGDFFFLFPPLLLSRWEYSYDNQEAKIEIIKE